MGKGATRCYAPCLFDRRNIEKSSFSIVGMDLGDGVSGPF